MTRFYNDHGIIIKKKNLLNDDKLITFLSKERGKITIFAKGIRKITSRRLSHLDYGNLLNFFYYKKGEYFYLRETELIYAFQKIKRSLEKTNFLYIFFFILNRLLPENQREILVYEKTLIFLRELNNQKEFSFSRFENYLKEILITLGFLTEKESTKEYFNLKRFIEELINEKLNWLILS